MSTTTTFAALIAQKRKALNDIADQQRTAAYELGELRDHGSADPARIAQLRAANDRLTREHEVAAAELADIERERDADAEDTRAAQITAPAAGAPRGGSFRTTPRSDTYTERDGGQFFRDLFAFSVGQARADTQARLQEHERAARDSGLLSERAINTGGLGGVVPPQYLVDQYAAIARAGRPTANIVQHLPLPETGMSLAVPRGVTGVATAVQAAQNTEVQNTDATFADITVPVVTVAGQQDVSRQAIERGAGTDAIIFADLAAAYAVSVNQQVLSGTGTSGQALGIFNTAGANQASAFTAAASVATFMSKLSGALNAIQTGRFLAADAIVMHPRRWSWLTMQVDSTGRPLIVPTGNGPTNALGSAGTPIVDASASTPVGQLLGVNVYTDPSIPTAAGSGPEDQVLVMRSADHLLWEDPAAPFQLSFEQTLGSKLTVKLVAYGTVAFTAARFPISTAIIGGNAAAGNGLIAPTW